MRRALVALAALGLAACATGGKLRAQAESLRAEADKARKAGALRCAPRELATADANLDFAEKEIAPNIRECIVGMQVISPKDIERIAGITGGNISVAAKQLGISRNTIYRKLRWNKPA